MTICLAAHLATVPAQTPEISIWVLALVGMALLPFVLTMITSFAKLVIVAGILRQALGLQQIPPASVLTGIAMILTLHIMTPTVREMYGAYERTEGQDLAVIVPAVSEPLRKFLSQRTDPPTRELFKDLSARLEKSAAKDRIGPPPQAPPAAWTSVLEIVSIDAPAFILSELRSAFIAGFLLFIPFLVIDLVVGNVLLALGMHMLSPVVISLPFKLLVFVLVDGWQLVFRQLIESYLVT